MKIPQYKINIFLLFVIFLELVYACDNFTEVELPSSQLTARAVFETKETANAAMIDIYSKIRENGLLTGKSTGTGSQFGLYTDELTYYGQSGTGQANFYNNSILASDSEISEWWNSSYSQIYAANAVLEGVALSKTLEAIDKQQLTGEALFVRALIHFYLVNTFGPIPYISTTDYRANGSVKRMPETQVYENLKNDLQKAIDFLPPAYNGSNRIRPNKGAAQALLARVCLYLRQWQEASNAASAVLNQTDLYVWPSSIDSLFEKESLSTIWQLMPATDGTNTYEGNVFNFSQVPPPVMAISTTLYSNFSSNDLRKTHWIKSITDGTNIWYRAYKYKLATNTSTSMEYSIVLRMAEQYLIRAEARAQAGDLIGAKEDLNKTRNLAGLQNTTAISAPQIIDAVLKERQLEFFTEFGHRFFDLKRAGLLDNTLTPQKLQWKSSNQFLPLPESELLLNPNLSPQNEGY